MSAISRRTLLDSTLKGAGLLAVAGHASRILGANDRANVAIIGVGGRGSAHINYWTKTPGARLAGLCDVNQAALERGSALAQKAAGEKPKEYADMRQVFADKDIDAVAITTPNHWHALATIWAVSGGQGRLCGKAGVPQRLRRLQMVEAARQYNRMVQVGSQSRSMPHKTACGRTAAARRDRQRLHGEGPLLQAAQIDRTHARRTGRPPGSTGTLPRTGADAQVLRESVQVQLALVLGHGQRRHRQPGRSRNGFRALGVWASGCRCRWSPRAVNIVYDDDQETPNTQLASFNYGPKELVFEVRGLPTGGEGDIKPDGANKVGNLFYGSEGWMAVDGNGFQVYKGEKSEKVMDEKAGPDAWDTIPHMTNFVKAIQSRNYKDLNADVEIGVLSASLCHLANISYRVGKELAWDAANRWFENDVQANLMLTRHYRRPYVVPDRV